jgi:hypothetical protein
MKQHLEDGDLILHFYGETGADPTPHLADCADCRARFQSLQRVLNSVPDLPPPQKGADYAASVWERLAPEIGSRRPWPRWFSPKRWAPVIAVLALLIVAFFAGRYSRREINQAGQPGPAVRERVLLVAVGDHLNRSKMLLIEIANADPERELDLSDGREMAEDLVYASRLYRQTAVQTGDALVVNLLDQLERVLLEISHSPAEVLPGQLRSLRERIEREGLIFKIRVAGSRLAQEEML